MNRQISFEYFYGKEADALSFYRVPKLLFTDEFFKGLSIEAKVLYGLLLDRMSLSMKNEWFDEEGRAFIYFSIEEIGELLGCGKNKAVRTLQELDEDGGIGLIGKCKKGQGKATRIYVKNFIINIEESGTESANDSLPDNNADDNRFDNKEEYAVNTECSDLENCSSDFVNNSSEVYESNSAEVMQTYDIKQDKTVPEVYKINPTSDSEVYKSNPEEDVRFKNRDSRIPKNKLLEVYKKGSNNTDINNTEFNKSNLILSDDEKGKDANDEYLRYAELVRKNIELDHLLQTEPLEKELIEGIYELIVETVMTQNEYIVIASSRHPTAMVKSRMLKLNSSHILYVLDGIKSNTTKVRNIKKYLLAALFNAPPTMSGYYQALVNHDMPQYAQAK